MRLTNIWLSFFTGLILLSGCGGGGGSGTSDTTNLAPVANAGIDKTVMVNETVTITGIESYDPDGTIVNYQWKEGTLILSNSPTFDYSPTTVGTHTLTLTVTDNDGATDSDQMNVNVTEAKKLPLVIIRVEFDDYRFSSSATVWSQKIFGSNDGQLNDYYNEISYGKFQFKKAIETDGSADGIITVKLDMDHPGLVEENIGVLKAGAESAYAYIDFSQYDTDNNKAISSDELQIMFLVAGGERATAADPGVWAHAWCMDSRYNVAPPTLNNVKLMSCEDDGIYSVFGEKHFDAETGHDATIGVIAHELGHAVFMIPDLYDTDGSSAGIGSFGLMGGGSWGYKEEDSLPEGYGATPVHMTGWSKVYSGFVTPTIITSSTNLDVNATSSKEYNLYKIGTGRTGEYFLVENRAASGYDRGLYSLQGASSFEGGLSILHIDDNLLNTCVTRNDCNDDETHKLVDVEEAKNAGLDSDADYAGHYNNLFFDGNSDMFTSFTTPNSDRYDGIRSGVEITNISNRSSTMNFDIELN